MITLELTLMSGLLLITTLGFACPEPMSLNLSNKGWTQEDQRILNNANKDCLREKNECAYALIKKDTSKYKGLYVVICSDLINKDQSKQPKSK